jgi:hypothetical protein
VLRHYQQEITEAMVHIGRWLFLFAFLACCDKVPAETPEERDLRIRAASMSKSELATKLFDMGGTAKYRNTQIDNYVASFLRINPEAYRCESALKNYLRTHFKLNEHRRVYVSYAVEHFKKRDLEKTWAFMASTAGKEYYRHADQLNAAMWKVNNRIAKKHAHALRAILRTSGCVSSASQPTKGDCR